MIKINREKFKKILSEVSNFTKKKSVSEQATVIKLDRASNSLIAGSPESQIKINLDDEINLDDDYAFSAEKAMKILTYSTEEEIEIFHDKNFIKFKTPKCSHLLNNYLANKDNIYNIISHVGDVKIEFELPINELTNNFQACNLFEDYSQPFLRYVYITNEHWYCSNGSTFTYISNKVKYNIEQGKFISIRKYDVSTILPFLLKQGLANEELVKIKTYQKSLTLEFGNKIITIAYQDCMDEQSKCLNEMLKPAIINSNFNVPFFDISLDIFNRCLQIASTLSKGIELSFNPETPKSIFLTSYEGSAKRDIQAKQEIELDNEYLLPNKLVGLACNYLMFVLAFLKKQKQKHIMLYFNEPTEITYIKMKNIYFLIAPFRI